MGPWVGGSCDTRGRGGAGEVEWQKLIFMLHTRVKYKIIQVHPIRLNVLQHTIIQLNTKKIKNKNSGIVRSPDIVKLIF